MAACLRFTRRVLKSQLEIQGHDALCLPNLNITRAEPGLVEASLKIEQYNVNRVGTVHGGLILSLTDTIGSLAVATKGQWMTGVSTDITTSFVRPAGRPGDILSVKGELTGMGKAFAFIRVEFMDPSGTMVAYGNHTKYVAKSHGHPQSVKFSEDGETVVEGEDLDVD